MKKNKANGELSKTVSGQIAGLHWDAESGNLTVVVERKKGGTETFSAALRDQAVNDRLTSLLCAAFGAGSKVHIVAREGDHGQRHIVGLSIGERKHKSVKDSGSSGKPEKATKSEKKKESEDTKSTAEGAASY
jgi:hypothetical protein